MSAFVGLDLAQSQDHSAIAVLEDLGPPEQRERTEAVNERRLKGSLRAIQKASNKGYSGPMTEGTTRFKFRRLDRLPTGMAYPKQIDYLETILRDPRLTVEEVTRGYGGTERIVENPPVLVVDVTGVGAAISDLLDERGLEHVKIVITGGDRVHRQSSSAYSVPKVDLISAFEVALHSGQVSISKRLKWSSTLLKEMRNFTRKTNVRTSNTSFEALREGDHDDLVLACSLACWAALNPYTNWQPLIGRA